MKVPHFPPRLPVRPAAWLLGPASIITMVATFSPTCGLAADAQASGAGPNPLAYALANAERAQEPKFRFIYNDDAAIDGLSSSCGFYILAIPEQDFMCKSENSLTEEGAYYI